jgi:hypothetical protein
MRRLISLVVLAAATATPAGAVPIKMTPAVQKDVQCFLLFAVAADQASDAKDDKSQQGTSLALTYFMGKLAVSAPGLNLAAAVRQEGDAFKGNTHAKEVGDACDAEFSKVGTQLQSLGTDLQKPEPAPAAKK